MASNETPHTGWESHSSYNNRYKTSSTMSDIPSHHQARSLSSISEIMDDAMDFGRLSFSDSYHPSKPIRQLSRMTSGDSCHSDDVFMESGVNSSPSGINMNKKTPLEATVSSASSASILPNPYNRVNHKFHSVFWCACCFYFVFFCCMPAVRFMEMSDKEYRRGNDILAQKYGRRATICFVLGTVTSIVMYACIFFLVIYFSTYMAS